MRNKSHDIALQFQAQNKLLRDEIETLKEEHQIQVLSLQSQINKLQRSMHPLPSPFAVTSKTRVPRTYSQRTTNSTPASA